MMACKSNAGSNPVPDFRKDVIMAKKKKYYIVPAVTKSWQVRTPFGGQEVAFSGMADGCCGVMLVFTNKRMAKKYAPHLWPIKAEEVDDD